ncbi:MAG TPA: rRNA maturation RNase YbeY [Dehalococcoidia bacterium]|nr:rRNA maturation RNase YbeY [Dehalococcoidia bacterium]
MEINVLIDEGMEGYLSEGWLQGIAGAVLLAENADPAAEMGLVITGQEKIQELNLVHLGEDKPTDVLSFPMLPDSGNEEESGAFMVPPDGIVHLGEVIISYPQAVIQAEEHGHSVEKEVAVLLIHGVLHLLGYDHAEPDEQRDMQAREADILAHLAEQIP